MAVCKRTGRVSGQPEIQDIVKFRRDTIHPREFEQGCRGAGVLGCRERFDFTAIEKRVIDNGFILGR